MVDFFEAAFTNLWGIAVVFSSVSALFGVYIVLFILAAWASSRRQGKCHKCLPIISWLLFIDLALHYTTRILFFVQARNPDPPGDEEARWTIPLLFLGSISVTVAGLLSDGLVAWRFYVIYEHKRWALYGPATAVAINAILGFSGDIQYLLSEGDGGQIFNNHLQVAFKTTAAWGYCMLAINAVLTAAIIGKIIYVALKMSKLHSDAGSRIPYHAIVEAIVESAFINFLGILLYEIATFAPTGNVETDFGVGYVFFCILPMFFGISQCLITVRLCLFQDTSPELTLPTTSKLVFAHSQSSSIATRSSRTRSSSSSQGIELPQIPLTSQFHEECPFSACVAKSIEENLACRVAGYGDTKAIVVV
ncbi:hypothetical protein BC835DRAFT_1409892 [Cytidiella melzeri]|nr:hypothetical protein BC835DRAFT_1409892 [Cytidiella melzeri]